MPRNDNETDLEYRRRVIDTKSGSFCAAKWYNATIWLGSGQTTSCHHPPAHAIDIEQIKINPKALHNTSRKKYEREQMQHGERPAGCEYCWKIEDIGRDNISDRVYKTVIYQDQDIDKAFGTPASEDINLKTLEIAFDRTCQFACSYCNPAFSSTWVRDIKVHGPYLDLKSDGRNHFTHIHSHSQLYKFNEINPYVEAFFQWWESDLHRTLDELRITGGEPLLSAHTWKLLDWFKTNQGRSQTRLAINSNLGKDVDIDRLLESVQGLEFDLYTSNESMPAQAEYIRDGLDYQLWIDNMVRLASSGRVRGLHVMCTINALCLESLPEFLTELLKLKSTWGKDFPNFTLNILRFPSFQSALVLPDQLREYHKSRLVDWLNTYHNHVMLHEHEINHVQRLIDYLDVVKTPHSEAFELDKLRNDFKRFYEQYDQRRGKEFASVFPSMKDWYVSLP
jgi:organic radical activating enzyme